MNRKWEINNVGEDGCMCGEMKWKGIEFYVHCHRICMDCQFGGIHIIKYPRGKYKKTIKVATAVAKYLSSFWKTDIEIKNEYKKR